MGRYKYIEQDRASMVSNEEKAQMPEILDLGMYDQDYLQLLAQGVDPVRKHLYERLLFKAGVSWEDTKHLMPLLLSNDLSADEEAIVKGFWQLVVG